MIRSLLFIPHYSATHPGHVWPVLVPGWSLNFEMFFYVIFAAVMIAARHRVVIMTALLALVILLGMVLPQGNPLTATYTSSLNMLFLGGVYVACLWKTGMIGRRLWILLPIGAVLLALSEQIAGPSALTRGVPAVAILIGALALEGRSRVPFLGLLGEASYSLYLSHILTLLVAEAAWRWLKLDAAQFMAPYFVLMIGSSVVVGIAVHLLVERPMMAMIKAWLAGRKRVPISAPA